MAASSASESIEVSAFTKEDGGALLLQELGIEGSCSTQDQELSNALSETWGGHALTIDMMARTMRARKKPLWRTSSKRTRTILEIFIRTRRRIENIYYDRPDDTESLWKIAFDQLEPLEEQIFGVLSMPGPNDVPAHIFHEAAGVEIWKIWLQKSELVTNVPETFPC